MDEIVTERSGSILRIELNRPAKKNAMTSAMYVALADIFNEAVRDVQHGPCFGMAQKILSARATISRIF
jgi:enoyl-CoA hydratase/carnithine racemase